MKSAEINHRVGIKAKPLDVYQALTTVTGLAGWCLKQLLETGRGRPYPSDIPIEHS